MKSHAITVAVKALIEDFQLPIDVEKIAKEKLNIEILKTHFVENLDLSGMLVRNGDQVFMAINSAQSKPRQRFTIAHEIGHYLLDEVKPIWVDKNIRPVHVSFRKGAGGTPSAYQLAEVRANRFAAELLMPADRVAQEFADLDKHGIDWSDDEPIRKLATRFGTSIQAMTIRLLELALLSPAFLD
ncbi:ImmA/IrrE family metallo-endopeptidase [Sulfobacillus thermosulfidooxidans]|uniref:ImmA/IrrE family metallo-endopeptidase n=1 Tax=Sulfobacillus thermosulfidooxidans TaxID=28034 RepID=UPI0006B42434|nr:ImmA/IrrE family metallo-endopeptidase [Sulfobacillus thermosulfidooxidans]